MMITRDILGLLCLVAWLLAGTAASSLAAARRAEVIRRDVVAARQAEALDELIFDAANYRLRRRPQQNKRPHDVVAASASAAAAASAAALHPQDGSKEGDKIAALPGQPQSNNSVDFDQYGGYVTVDAEHGRALFYYFAEAARSAADPSSRPLLLWLNGGPGCSSIGFGAMEELGPFRVMSDGKTLYRNPFAWNKVANVLFLESPAGVGFSYSNTSDDYERSGDGRTAEDAYAFLINWMERFPEYKGRDFFIAGESYAGHYVPQLAQTILRHNNANKDQAAAGRDNIATINLKGIMMGNAVINDETDTRGMYDYFWTHALMSDEAIGAIHKSCNFSADSGDQSKRCLQALESIQFGNLDIYNIYAPLCRSSGVADSQRPKRPSVNNFDPCTDAYVNAYLNDPKVQQALHANVTKLKYPWSSCSQVISDWQDSPSTILPIITELLSSSIQVWIYSGDVDGRVPVTSTRYSINQLKLSVKTPWRPWSIDDEVGGYSVIYEGNLTFVTVRGAGHEVPSYQPLRALVLVQYFLMGKQLPA